MSYLFGSTDEQRFRTHALNVLVVDFDGPAAIPEALAAAYDTMQGDRFPTLEFRSASTKYPDPASVRNAVCRGDYWGAVYVHEGASSRLALAVGGGATDAYQSNDTVTYIYNQARYTTIVESAIRVNLETLISASRDLYYETADGRAALAALDRADPPAVRAYLDPIRASSDTIAPTLQGSRTFYNTLNMVFPILITFFYLLAVNGISDANKLALRLRRRELWLMRFALGKVYALAAALVITAYMWAFREDWAVTDAVFAKNWMIVWWQIDINWQVFDAFIGSYVPLQFNAFFMLTWVVLNVASAAFPFEVAPDFYRVGYALPGRNIYTLQIQAWTGCGGGLEVALPVLFAWWLLGHVATIFSARKRHSNANKVAGVLLFKKPLE